MNFRTNIQLREECNQIDYHSKLLLIGSCFSENISNKLSYFKFQTYSNPFGILFNPIAIEKLISNAIHLKKYTEKDIFQLNERWHCFDAHSDLSAIHKEDLLHNLNSAVELMHQQLRSASHIIITLGTSWVYKNIETDTVVGNCHKIPQKKFLKELLSIEEVLTSLQNITSLIKNVNPTSNIIFTVSPVRHIKDGFVENMQSKAHLISAIHQLIEISKQGFYGTSTPLSNHFQPSKLSYFPSYEIMMDDLRDYRFYANDMVHPNETAVNYIWEQFQHVWLSKETQPIMKEVDSIQKGLTHRPFNPTSEQHQQFLNSLQNKITSLKNKNNILF